MIGELISNRAHHHCSYFHQSDVIRKQDTWPFSHHILIQPFTNEHLTTNEEKEHGSESQGGGISG